MTKKMTKKMKGGVQITQQYLTDNAGSDRTTACSYFLKNSTVKLLTNSSISCITLVVTLNHGITSPFSSIRSNNIEQSVNRLLLKVFITNTTSGWYTTPTCRDIHPGIEITSFESFENEIKIQRDIYKESFMSKESVIDAICPAIVNFNIYTKHDELLGFYKSLVGLPTNDQTQLDDILGAFGKDDNSISCILMEYMDNCDTAYNTLKQFKDSGNIARYNIFLQIILYEIQRLNRLGYRHGDAHLGNIMIDPDYQYFTRSRNPAYLGRVFIIDFGRTRKLDASELSRVRSNDETIFKEEVQHTILDPLRIDYITPEEYKTINDYRMRVIEGITLPKFRPLCGLAPSATIDDLIEYLKVHVMNNNNYIYSGGGNLVKNFSIKHIMKNNKMKKFEKMLDDNSKEYEKTEKWVKELKEYRKTFFEKFKSDMEAEDKMDPSLFVKQEQIKNMAPADFIKRIQDDFRYQDDIVESLEKQIKQMKKEKGGKSKKIKSNSIRKSKKLYGYRLIK